MSSLCVLSYIKSYRPCLRLMSLLVVFTIPRTVSLVMSPFFTSILMLPILTMEDERNLKCKHLILTPGNIRHEKSFMMYLKN